VKSNLEKENIENKHIGEAVARFLQLRKNNISKRPATSELIDWIASLQHKGLLSDELAKWKNADPAYRQKIKDTLGTLAKSKQDFETLSHEIAG
jgi:hypothetical protein